MFFVYKPLFHYVLLFSSNFNFHNTGIFQKPAIKNVHFFRRFYTEDNNIARCMHACKITNFVPILRNFNILISLMTCTERLTLAHHSYNIFNKATHKMQLMPLVLNRYYNIWLECWNNCPISKLRNSFTILTHYYVNPLWIIKSFQIDSV